MHYKYVSKIFVVTFLQMFTCVWSQFIAQFIIKYFYYCHYHSFIPQALLPRVNLQTPWEETVCIERAARMRT